MKALVLGGNGFIGSHLVDRLLAEGDTVRVFDRFAESYRAPQPQVDYRMAEFGDSFALAEALEGMNVVFHLISTTVPSTSNLDPVADIESNLTATVRLLDLMLKAGLKRIVFLSSGGTVYGNPEVVPIVESHPLRPICSYGVVKVAVENYLYMFQYLHGLSPIIIRPSNAYGPRQGHIGVQGVIATFLNKVMNNEPIVVWGDGSIVRDYIYVEDLAQLCTIAGKSNKTGTYNVGYGRGCSISDIISAISIVTGTNPDIHYETARSFDVEKIVLDITLAPIKRPLSRRNTSPSQKMMSFYLQGQHPVRKKTLSFICSRVFKCFGAGP